MAIRLKSGVYQCMFCDFTNPDGKLVDAHQAGEHNYVLVPMTVNELFDLLQFITMKDESYLPPRLYKRLKEYLNNANRRNSYTKGEE